MQTESWSNFHWKYHSNDHHYSTNNEGLNVNNGRGKLLQGADGSFIQKNANRKSLACAASLAPGLKLRRGEKSISLVASSMELRKGRLSKHDSGDSLAGSSSWHGSSSALRRGGLSRENSFSSMGNATWTSSAGRKISNTKRISLESLGLRRGHLSRENSFTSRSSTRRNSVESEAETASMSSRKSLSRHNSFSSRKSREQLVSLQSSFSSMSGHILRISNGNQIGICGSVHGLSREDSCSSIASSNLSFTITRTTFNTAENSNKHSGLSLDIED